MVVGGHFWHDNNRQTTIAPTLCILPQNPTCLNAGRKPKPKPKPKPSYLIKVFPEYSKGTGVFLALLDRLQRAQDNLQTHYRNYDSKWDRQPVNKRGLVVALRND